jgi:hypothetical protein
MDLSKFFVSPCPFASGKFSLIPCIMVSVKFPFYSKSISFLMAELEQLIDSFYLTRLNFSPCSRLMPSSSRNAIRNARGPGRSMSPALPTTDEYIKQVHETREALRLFNTLHLLNTPVSRVAMEELVNTTVSSIFISNSLAA